MTCGTQSSPRTLVEAKPTPSLAATPGAAAIGRTFTRRDAAIWRKTSVPAPGRRVR